VIFYPIYKNQEITFTIGVHLLQWGPWKEFGCCNVAPGRLAGAGEPIPASSPPDLAGEGLGRGLGTSGGRFGMLDRAEVAPATREGRPRWRPFPVVCGRGRI
jgi:hypothetical protein